MRWKAPGLRLPITDPEPAPLTPCDRNPAHTGGIRFELHRYGRKHGYIHLCGVCVQEFLIRPDPDPRYVEAA